MADLYRKSSLERISSPEQLDQALKVTTPMSWLALAAITVVIIVTVVWSFLGTIPETVTVRGIVSPVVGSAAVYTEYGGKVTSIQVHEGWEVKKGDVIMYYLNSDHERVALESSQAGVVTNIILKEGDEFTPGVEVIRIRPQIESSQMVVCYVPIADVKKLKLEMTANISLDSLDSRSYGHMVARIDLIDTNPASTSGMTYVLGANNQLDSLFNANGSVVAVTCQLYPDKRSVSGYYWSTDKGDSVVVENYSLVTAKIVTKNVPPITKLFSRLLDLWGD